jgi:putative ABC transport system permease protein
MRSLISHLRLTIRLLLKSPGFTIMAILIFGLGIGANTAIFSLVNGVLLKPLPYPHPERLVQIFQPFQNFDQVDLSYPDYVDFSANQHSFDSMTAFLPEDFNLSGRGEPERISGLSVTADFFRMLGRPFLIGRPFGEAEEKPDAAAVVVISEHLWRTRFHSDRSLIGDDLSLNGKRFQVVGVTPAEANEAAQVELYVPLGQNPRFGTLLTTNRGNHNFVCVARLKEGADLGSAQADLAVIRQNLAVRYPETDKAFGIRLVPYLDSAMTGYSLTLWLLEGAVACLLLITCANVANLLLARARERRREISIRSALGASRLRLIIQLLFESTVLAVLGGIVGLLLSTWALTVIRSLAPPDVARFQEISLDAGTLLFVLAITLLTALLSGLVPALANSEINLASALKQEGDRSGTAGRERHRTQAFLVGGQVALTSVLLIGAGLLLRSFQALQNAPLGFNPGHVLSADIYLADKKYATQADCQEFFDRLVSRINRLPGVTDASFDAGLPFAGGGSVTAFGIAGEPDPELSQCPILYAQYISPNFFRTAGVSVLSGRFFSDQDSADKEKVVVINERLAHRYFPGQNPIGKQLHDFFDLAGLKRNFFTIVGVVGDVQYSNPESQQTPYEAYYPVGQYPVPSSPINGGTIVIRAGNDPRSLIVPLKKIVADLDPNIPVYDVGLLDDLVAKSFATKRLATVVVSLFSGAALLLAAVGLYGVLSYSVSQRKREIGVRMALGAQSNSILHLVIKRGLIVVGIGLMIGLITALVLSRLIAGILYGVSATDFVSIGLSILILGLVALLACLLPALRATRIDPITALRE